MDASLLNSVTKRKSELFGLLQELVLIQSGSENKKGVDRVGRVITQYLEPLHMTLKIIKQEQYGDHLVFSTPAAQTGNSILLTGHMDTVFPEHTDFNWYREDNHKVYGPGVIDMKGGLVVTMGAVQALADTGQLKSLPLVLFFNSDEEIGSPSSTPHIEVFARKANCAFVTECGGINGEVVTGRRGKTGYMLSVQGRAGHAAFAGKEKASAIVELCKKILSIEKLNDVEHGLIVNVGVIKGGIGANSVAKQATAQIDTRFSSLEKGIELEKKLDGLARVVTTPGTAAEISITNRRPVMVESQENLKLYEIVSQQAKELGLAIKKEIRQGVSDASNIASLGVPVIDGMGPIGEFDHSNREYMLKDSLVPRCCLLASAIKGVHKSYF